MKFEDANKLIKDLEVRAGDFIEIDVAGTALALKPNGGMRLVDGQSESVLSKRHFMETHLRPAHGPIEVETVMRGYFEEWHSGRRAYLVISGNGSVSRVALAHLEGLRLVGGPTLGA